MSSQIREPSYEFYEFKGRYYRASRDNFVASDVLMDRGWSSSVGEHGIDAVLSGARLKRDPSLPPIEAKPGEPLYPHVVVPMSGEDQNSLVILGRAQEIARAAGLMRQEIDDFGVEAIESDNLNVKATVERWFATT